ncbi:hypothetical protein EMCRGX_G026448 [Ephydatia muelleri]
MCIFVTPLDISVEPTDDRSISILNFQILLGLLALLGEHNPSAMHRGYTAAITPVAQLYQYPPLCLNWETAIDPSPNTY